MNIQHIIFEKGGSVYLDVQERPTTATFRVLMSDGAELIPETNAVISSISTTVNDAAVSMGDVSVTLTNAASISVGNSLWLRDPDEEVRVKAKSGNTCTLWYPLLYAHDNASTAEGTRVSYTIPASNATSMFFDGAVEWTLDTNDVRYTPLISTRYSFYRAATMADVVDTEAHVAHIIPHEWDIERVLDRALEDVITKVGAKHRPFTYRGASAFAQANVYAFLVRLYGSRSGEEARERRKDFEMMLANEIDEMVAQVPRDTNQDTAVTEDEKSSFRSIRLHRT